MLYPKEDEDAHKLQFTCRTCQYTEEATSSCVFRNAMNNAAGETAGVTQDVGSDPTVCTNAPLSVHSPPPPSADGNLAVCLRCGVTLLHCDRCKDPASVQEYSEFVARNPDFAVEKTLEALRVTNYYWNAQDDDEKAAWAQKFSSIDEFAIPELPEHPISAHLRIDLSFMTTDEDPPEALENPDESYPEYDPFSA